MWLSRNGQLITSWAARGRLIYESGLANITKKERNNIGQFTDSEIAPSAQSSAHAHILSTTTKFLSLLYFCVMWWWTKGMWAHEHWNQRLCLRPQYECMGPSTGKHRKRRRRAQKHSLIVAGQVFEFVRLIFYLYFLNSFIRLITSSFLFVLWSIMNE